MPIIMNKGKMTTFISYVIRDRLYLKQENKVLHTMVMLVFHRMFSLTDIVATFDE